MGKAVGLENALSAGKTVEEASASQTDFFEPVRRIFREVVPGPNRMVVSESTNLKTSVEQRSSILAQTENEPESNGNINQGSFSSVVPWML